jgi:Na+:H+ antiporter, NhaA family
VKVLHHVRRITQTPASVWRLFVAEESRSSAVLLLAAVGALVWANASWTVDYQEFWQRITSLGPITFDLRHWLNEGFMAFFFLLVGIEIKRELIDGELRGWSKAAYPIVGAVGGMIVPAVIFLLINPMFPESRGWAVPIATDIALAAGVIGLLGKRIPKKVRVFLLTLAIVDDILSILVISIFYSQPQNAWGILIAIASFGLMAAFRDKRVWPFVFAIAGIAMWFGLAYAHVPATLAGVLIAAIAPLKTSRKHAKHLQSMEAFEEAVLPIVTFGIVPLFVLANAGITLNSLELHQASELRVFIGTALGLILGKPLGIYLATRIFASIKSVHQPSLLTHRQTLGVGALAGIGFTIGIFISDLAYTANPTLGRSAIGGIFLASICSAGIGLLLLKKQSNKISTLDT